MFNSTEYIIFEKYNLIAQQLTKYVGVPLYILCLVGTLMNVLTFLQRTYNCRACSIYLLTASLFDCAHLTVGSLSNILQYGFHYDWTISSNNYCKIKTYFVFVLNIISGTLTVLAAIDQFALSSRKYTQWKYSTRSFALKCIQFTILFWFIFTIPSIFCTERYSHSSHNDQLICSNPSRDIFCFITRIIYSCIFDGCFPPVMMMIFGLLTYNNVRQLHQRSQTKSIQVRKVNQQITSMVILQSIKSTFASFPLTIFYSYLLISIKLHTTKSLIYQAKENLIMQIVYLLFWSNYTSFFVYIYSSDIFRAQWIKAMKKFIHCFYTNRQRHYYHQTELNQMRN